MERELAGAPTGRGDEYVFHFIYRKRSKPTSLKCAVNKSFVFVVFLVNIIPVYSYAKDHIPVSLNPTFPCIGNPVVKLKPP